MSGVWVCPRNHSWRTQPADAEATLDVSQECPVCGEQGSWRSDVLTGIEAITARDAYRPTNVPGYEIHEELGRGAMGVVYRARDVQLNRTVALKMILAGSHAAPTDRARFRREVESVAALQHPNIVQIHAVGEVEGLPYCALEYVAGGTLSKRLKQGALPPMAAARLIRTLARATHYAHQNGIIHRDLKPGNVLLRSTSVETTDERVSSLASAPTVTSVDDLLPKIADFGLAKRLDSDMSLTGSSAVLGTPSNMAPEQADGRNRTVTAAADVYGLGTILYECLTGRPVFKASSPLETLHQVLNADPPSLRAIDPKVPRDLETVCLKCLRKDPTQRYASAEELADDLDRFLAGEPVRARAAGLAERTWRRARRQNALLLVIAGAFALTLGVVALEKIGLIGGRSVYVNSGAEQMKPTDPAGPEIKVRAVTASGEIQGHGFLTSEKGVIQVSSDLLGMTEANSPRPKSLQVNIRSADGSWTAHDAEVALVEPRFKLALVRLLGGTMPEPAKLAAPVEAKPVETDKAAPNQLTIQAVERIKRATVAIKWQRDDKTGGVATGCLVKPGIVITTLAALGLNDQATPVPDTVAVIIEGGTPQEIGRSAKLLVFDRSTGLVVLQIKGRELPEPLTFGQSATLSEGQRLFVVGFPSQALHSLTTSVKIRQTEFAGRLATPSGGIRYFQLEGAPLLGGFIVDASGNIVGVSADGIAGSTLSFGTPIEMAQELLRGRVTSVIPGQPYEVHGRLELPIEITLADPMNKVNKVSLEVWMGESATQTVSGSRPNLAGASVAAAVTLGLGQLPDPDHKFGEPRRYAGAVELPVRSASQVYWACPRYFDADGQERGGDIILLPVSPPVQRLPANIGTQPFVAGESTVLLTASDRSMVSGEGVYNSGRHAYHEKWEERTPAGDRLAFRCTQVDYEGKSLYAAPLKEILTHLKGSNGILLATSSGAAIEKLDVATMPLATRNPVKRINTNALNNIYSFAIRSSSVETRPDDYWSEDVKLPISIGQLSNEGQAEYSIKYQYLGRRSFDGRDEAIITWIGQTLPQSTVRGKSRGVVALDLQTGRVRLGWRMVDSEYSIVTKANDVETKTTVVTSLDLQLRRNFGPTLKPPSPNDVLPGRAIEVIPFVGAPDAKQ